MNSELFVELSDNQQEIISGGGQGALEYLNEYIDSSFNTSATQWASVSSVGPGGATTVQGLTNNHIAVDLSKYFNAGFMDY
jgi:hypothetical protein